MCLIALCCIGMKIPRTHSPVPGISTRLIFVLLFGCSAVRASAQASTTEPRTGNATLLGINMAIGAVTAGVWRASNHRPVWQGVGRGAAAGALVFAGKRIIAEERPLAWWTGRQLAAIGSSEVANAGRGAPILQRVVLPVGPIRIHVDRTAKRKVAVRLDLASTVAITSIALESDSHFALQESLATSAVVFLTPKFSGAVGSHTAGAVKLSEFVPDGDFARLEAKRNVLSHEMIHAAQYDFLFTALGDPIQRELAAKIPGGRPATRFVDFNLTLIAQLVGNAVVSYDYRPWEKEARSIAKDSR